MAERRKILITGATGGIGLALARRLAVRHDVLLTGRKATHPDLPAGAFYVEADQQNPVECATSIIAAFERLGWNHLDNAILNAGTGTASLDGLDTAQIIRNTLDVNLCATVSLARALFPFLQAAHGTLTCVGSVAHKGAALFPAYAASKAGLDAFARALRAEWQGRVCVQIVHPGPARTQMHAKAGFDPGKVQKFFIDPDTMADMLERAVAGQKSPVKLSFLRRASFSLWKGRLL
jgi:NAD(P)-dependent dehydrogenase (short-subunit alcohol dehydrogenase family)